MSDCLGCPNGTKCPVMGILVGPPQRERCERDAAWREKVAALKAGKNRPQQGGHGLGDRVERALKAVGIHQAVKAVSKAVGRDCGCAKRKARLNEWFPGRGDSPADG